MYLGCMRTLFLVATPLMMASCHKGDVSGPEACPPITGISSTDPNGAAIFPPDTTDWRTVDDWCPQAEALFADQPPVTLLNTPWPEALLLAYPNPCSSQFMLHITNDTLLHPTDVRIVNDAYELVYTRDSIIGQAIIPTDAWGAADGRLFRVFYRIEHPDGTAHRGHGDVRFGP